MALPSHDVDPFLEADAQMELEGLMERAVPVERCSVQEYIEGDDSLAVCTDLDSENWEANFWQSLDKIIHVEMTELMNRTVKHLVKNFLLLRQHHIVRLLTP